MMMASLEIRLVDFLQEDSILCNLETSDRNEAVERLVAALHHHLDGFDRDEAVEAVLEREKLAPTVVAEGLALPHARLADIERPVLGVVTSRRGIDFRTVDEDIIHVMVLILTPKDDPGSYLRLMASLTRQLNSPHVIKRLAVAVSAREVHGIIVEGPEALTVHLNALTVSDHNPVTIDEGDSLAAAIQAFCTNRVMDLPVVDAEGDLRGVIAIEDLLDLSLPEHLLWMEDLSAIENFEPFAELLRKDGETKVADFMHDSFVSVPPEMPAIQLAKIFLMEKVRQIQVVEGRHFIGSVDVHNFSSQIFWA